MSIVNTNTEKSYKGRRYFCSDFVEIQRKSYFSLLEKGLIEEFLKRNPINNVKRDLEFSFYPSYYKLTKPAYNPREAILKGKSYTSQLYMPIQLIDKKNKIVKFKWVYIGNLPLMTKRGHFIINGSPRIIINQMIRSPGIYYQELIDKIFSDEFSKEIITIKRMTDSTPPASHRSNGTYKKSFFEKLAYYLKLFFKMETPIKKKTVKGDESNSNNIKKQDQRSPFINYYMKLIYLPSLSSPELEFKAPQFEIDKSRERGGCYGSVGCCSCEQGRVDAGLG